MERRCYSPRDPRPALQYSGEQTGGFRFLSVPIEVSDETCTCPQSKWKTRDLPSETRMDDWKWRVPLREHGCRLMGYLAESDIPLRSESRWEP